MTLLRYAIVVMFIGMCVTFDVVIHIGLTAFFTRLPRGVHSKESLPPYSTDRVDGGPWICRAP